MRTFAVLSVLVFAALTAVSQSAVQPAQTAQPASTSSPILADLDRLQSAASQANVDIAHMRIEKWKADNASKQQAQGNADSLQRNLSSALPGLIAGYRNDPQNLNSGFKLYRNLNALYDVLASFTEAAGAFGPKNEYETLGQQVNVIDSVRRNLADYIDSLTSQTQNELNQLRTQVHALQQAAVNPPAPPKKVVVDNAEPPKKATHKKKAAAASSESGAATKPAASSQPASPAQPKPQ